eukprot:TRINITY_DN36516_c0_g1_i1.p1 TRINITY_DN36516_c0_g1~~TRINITY_DN36516_c0_g1_i1.p1  ORF type:complete len:186 (+),score=21.63 TRINITY_DN36516_c0_g1_i1:50-559(+)
MSKPNPAETPSQGSALHPAEAVPSKNAPAAAAAPAVDQKRTNYHGFVFGNKVTGIGLRARIATAAESQHVYGWSQNLSDHTVELVGNGTTPQVKKLSKFIRDVPNVSRVAEQFQHTTHRGAYKHFYSIGHHGHATQVGKSWPYQADYVGDIPQAGLRHPPKAPAKGARK